MVRLDRQPLGSTVLPGLSLPAHVGLATYNMLGAGGMGVFADVVVDGAVAALAVGESVIKCPFPLNMLKATYDHSCY
jgi:hypothetical protein